MSLESKSKTTKQIYSLCTQRIESLAMGACGNQKAYKEAAELGKIVEGGKWVPLEEAQKELTIAKDEVEMWKKNRNIYVEKKNKLYAQIEAANKILSEILEGLTNKLPIAEKITQYDPETKEDWIIEVPDQHKYSAFFDWVDENLGRWKVALNCVDKTKEK